MSSFCSDQGRTRVCGPRKAGQEGVRQYAAARNPRIDPGKIGSTFHRSSAETCPPHRQGFFDQRIGQ
jgi:hypothetical protein